MMFTNNANGNCFAKDPAVVRFNGIYFLYHSILPSEAVRKSGYRLGIGIATSTDMECWENIGEVLPTQDCEKKGIAAPGAIVIDGVIHLFYQTYELGKNDSICHAVSTDGIKFIKDETNPIYHPTKDWCCGRAIDADVCAFNNRLYLYIATRDHDMNIQKIGVAHADLKSDFSRGTWTQTVNQSVLSPEIKWEGKCIEAPATIVVDGRVFMFYGGSYNCTPQQIGCAVSDDGVFFKRISNVPFLPCGKENDWNSSESGHPYVFEDNGKTYLFYQGSNDMGKTWYISKQEIAFENGIPKLK